MKKSKHTLLNVMMTGASPTQSMGSNAQAGPSFDPSPDETIRLFQVHVSEEKLQDLKRRLLEYTNWIALHRIDYVKHLNYII